MNVDFADFIGQVLPGLFLVYVFIPLSVLLLWFLLVRPFLKKRGWIQSKPTEETTPTSAPTIADEVTSAPKIDTDMLPDLDMILQSTDEASHALPADGVWAVTLADGATCEAESLLTVMRDTSDDSLIVVIDGVGYRSLKDAGQPRQTFTRVMKDLSSTILQGRTSEQVRADADEAKPEDRTTSIDTTTSGESVADTETKVADENATVETSPTPEKPPAIRKRTTKELPTLPDGTLPGDLPSYKFDDNPARIEKKSGGRVMVEFSPPPDLDIPSAIEAYLQYKIQYFPEYQGRNIHVLPALDGGVRIRVDDAFFDAVSDVTDDDVRQFLQETIAEWQDRQG